MLLLVPGSLREAAEALGVSRWRTVVGVILPSALGGIVTSTVLAVARAAGETAPLIFLCSVFDGRVVSSTPSEALPNIPVTDLAALRGSEPGRLRPGLGRLAGAADRDPPRQPRRPRPARPQPSEGEAVSRGVDGFAALEGGGAPAGRVRIQDPVAAGTNGAARREVGPRRSSRPTASPSTTARKRALAGVDLRIPRSRITALIGPSGCGKTTFLRSLNRMNDSVPGFRLEGQILYHGHDLYAWRRRPGRGAAADRHGLPETEPVPEVDLRQRRLGAAQPRA